MKGTGLPSSLSCIPSATVLTNDVGFAYETVIFNFVQAARDFIDALSSPALLCIG